MDPQLAGPWPGLSLFTWPHAMPGAMATFWVSGINGHLGFPVTSVCGYWRECLLIPSGKPWRSHYQDSCATDHSVEGPVLHTLFYLMSSKTGSGPQVMPGMGVYVN